MSHSAELDALLKSLRNPGLKSIDLSLGRMERYLEAHGSPEASIPPAVHVAGTNGKGSAIAFLRAALEEAGYRCHVYTSPHLVHVRERFVVAGEPVDEPTLIQALASVKERTKEHPLTYFEALTACAFELFANTKADITLLETGMGGRFDATNAITPLVSAITSIGLDHQQYLGNTEAKIAFEKAGIIKPSIPVVTAPQADDVLAVIKDVASQKQARLLLADDEVYGYIPLPGQHQKVNAAVALSVLGLLKHNGFELVRLATGAISEAQWPARLQKLPHGTLVDLLPEGKNLWLDSAHNKPAATQLAHWMGEQHRKFHVIVSMSDGHRLEDFLPELTEHMASCHVLEIPDEEMTQPLAHLLSTANRVFDGTRAHASIEAAIAAAANLEPQAADILICGSLYLAGKVLEKNS